MIKKIFLFLLLIFTMLLFSTPIYAIDSAYNNNQIKLSNNWTAFPNYIPSSIHPSNNTWVRGHRQVIYANNVGSGSKFKGSVQFVVSSSVAGYGEVNYSYMESSRSGSSSNLECGVSSLSDFWVIDKKFFKVSNFKKEAIRRFNGNNDTWGYHIFAEFQGESNRFIENATNFVCVYNLTDSNHLLFQQLGGGPVYPYYYWDPPTRNYINVEFYRDTSDAINNQTNAIIKDNKDRENRQKQEQDKEKKDNKDKSGQMAGLFNFTAFNPFSPIFGLFVSSDCVNISTIASMLKSNNTQYCSWFSVSVRSILTPAIGISAMMLIFGFFVRWLTGSNLDGTIRIKGGK